MNQESSVAFFFLRCTKTNLKPLVVKWLIAVSVSIFGCSLFVDRNADALSSLLRPLNDSPDWRDIKRNKSLHGHILCVRRSLQECPSQARMFVYKRFIAHVWLFSRFVCFPFEFDPLLEESFLSFANARFGIPIEKTTEKNNWKKFNETLYMKRNLIFITLTSRPFL